MEKKGIHMRTVLCEVLEGRGRECAEGAEEGALILQLEGREEGH